MYDIVQKISHLVERQFPAVYREEGENFIAFVKAYYEWLEQYDQAVGEARNLFQTRDIDTTNDEFLEHFRKKYFVGLPKSIEGNQRFLQKHILDLYRSKGSEEGTKLLFRLLYNEDIQIYIPSRDILKPSDGVWVEPRFIEVANNPRNYLYNGKFITGVGSGATAYVDNYKRIYIDGKIVHAFFVTNILGTFNVGEQIFCDGVDVQVATFILGSPVSLDVDFGTPEQPVGETFVSYESVGRNKIYGIVEESYDITDGFINFVVQNGGTKYSALANISVTTGSNTTGSSAGFTGFTLTDTENFTYNTNIINFIKYDDTKYFNPYYDVKSSNDYIQLANSQFSNGDLVRYLCAPGNTAISGLSNTSYYYVAEANTSGLKLTTTYNDRTFNANSGVNNSTDFVSITTNPFSNGTPVLYAVSAGNTALTNLANNTYYYAISANSTGMKLATTYNPAVTFNPALSVNTNISNEFLLVSNNTIANDTIVRYLVAQGNTSIATLANNTYYYVVGANTLGLKLSATLSGTAINLYSTSLPSQDGHYIYGPGTAIDLTKGLTESGHAFFSSGSAVNITAGLNEFGHSLTGVGVTFNANADVDGTNEFITIPNNLFGNGDRVKYHVALGNTALTNLTNNSIYWVVSSNSTGVKLAATYNGTAINLTKGATQTGHSFTGVSLVETLLNVASYGSDLSNANGTNATTLDAALTDSVMTVGTITRLTGVNPGRNYDGEVLVRVRDNYTASYGLFDTNNNIEGQNANVTGKAIRGNDIPLTLVVKDSGFGYNTNGETITVVNTNDSDKTTVARIVLGGVGIANGYWLSDKGKLSDFPKLHDNYYYQEYSYEIQTNKTLDKYLKILRDVVHPAGNIPFGKPVMLYKNTTPITIVGSYISTQAS